MPMSFFEESRIGGFIFWRFWLSDQIIVKMCADPMESIQNNVSLWARAEETIGHQGMYNGNISWMETNLSKFGKQAMLYAMGNRIAKIVSTPTKNDTTAYVRDASGNVLAVISDKVNLYGHDNRLDSARATIASASDYYPFGLAMQGRTYQDSVCRYGFNGKRKDNRYGRIAKYNYGFRIYSPEDGVFLSVDPLTREYPWYTPYQYAGNEPIV